MVFSWWLGLLLLAFNPPPPPATAAVDAPMEFYQSGNPFRTLLHIFEREQKCTVNKFKASVFVEWNDIEKKVDVKLL